MILGDFHMHSTFSDGKLTIPALVDLYGQAGFGAIAITDHLCESQTVLGRAANYFNRTLTPANIELYFEILKSEAERAWNRYRMVVIPGFELTKNTVSNHRSAHIVALGVSEWIDPSQDPLAIAKDIRSKGGLAIAAHPVWTQKWEKQTFHLWGRREELSPYIDAWEVASGPVLFDLVLRSGLPMIASSDLHRPEQMTSWKTLLDCESTPEGVMDAIRKQKLEFTFYQGKDSNDTHVSNAVLLGRKRFAHLDAAGDLAIAQAST